MSNPNAASGGSNPIPPSDPTQQSYMRRSSYASVVAGASQANPRNPRHSTGTQSEEYAAAGRARGLDSDAATPHAPWLRSGPGAQEPDDFFIPSYLKSSRYAEQLEREHKARLAEKSRARSASNPPNAARASSNPGAGGGARRMSMHRGGHDEQPKVVNPDDLPPPLPTKWNAMDRNNSLEIFNSGLDVKFSGVQRGHDEAAVVRADHPMPKAGGIYYFEIQVLSKGREG
jgi:hypothetical protein